MRITKVKHKDGKTDVTWSVQNGDDRETRRLRSTDEPRPEFTEALDNLVGDVLHALELPPDYAEKVDLATVSIDRDGDGNMGVIFSLRAKVAAGTFSISAPRLREPGEDGDGEGDTMLTAAQQERLAALTTAAAAYVTGERQQGDLFADGGEAEVEEPAGAEA